MRNLALFTLALPLIVTGLAACTARSPASSAPAISVLPRSVAVTTFALAMSVGDIVGEHTARGRDGMARRCWNYKWGPEFRQVLAEQREVLEGDSLHFEVLDRPDRPFQLGGVVTDIWYESHNEAPGEIRWEAACYAGKATVSVLARVTVRWELFDSRPGKVLYRTTTSGIARARSFGAAFDEALLDAESKLEKDDELLALLSG